MAKFPEFCGERWGGRPGAPGVAGGAVPGSGWGKGRGFPAFAASSLALKRSICDERDHEAKVISRLILLARLKKLIPCSVRSHSWMSLLSTWTF